MPYMSYLTEKEQRRILTLFSITDTISNECKYRKFKFKLNSCSLSVMAWNRNILSLGTARPLGFYITWWCHVAGQVEHYAWVCYASKHQVSATPHNNFFFPPNLVLIQKIIMCIPNKSIYRYDPTGYEILKN